MRKTITLLALLTILLTGLSAAGLALASGDPASVSVYLPTGQYAGPRTSIESDGYIIRCSGTDAVFSSPFGETTRASICWTASSRWMSHRWPPSPSTRQAPATGSAETDSTSSPTPATSTRASTTPTRRSPSMTRSGEAPRSSVHTTTAT